MINISPKAFFFDFDGVICDSEKAHMFATLEVAKAYQISFSEDDYFKDLFGFDDKGLFEFLFEKHKLELSEEILKKLIKEKNNEFLSLIESDLIFFDGVIDLIKEIAQRNIPIVIVSGALNNEIIQSLSKADLNKYFSFIVSANMVKYGKPHPEPYQTAFSLMKKQLPDLKKEECWVLEDSPSGIISANETGLKTIAIPNSTKKENLGMADHIIESYGEIKFD